MNLKRAIQIIEGGAWCSIRFITADIKKGTGGKVIELAKCRIARKNTTLPDGMSIPSGLRDHVDPTFRSNPHHNLNFTRNLQLPNNQIRKVHPILITHLNQEEVI